ncbi:hypothetical protein L596_020605 [Steinernema carpocapsae]|uniref:Uncharacterized protein n=1 Tax=Steinernema carpocapsae TaxID=34508 RepID=A0A4U5MUS9_STECR|nr:hypothetical protein L596_020605 [Steinernema carpocapsae]
MPEVRLRFILLVFIVGSFFDPIVSRPCNSNVCFNGGSCEIDEDERFFQCICPAGYTGTICETEVEECTLNCGSNGKCARDEESDTQKCECNMGFTGKTCEEKDESCLVKGCPQGQICLSDSEVPKCVDDPCNKNQCSNDSKCVTGKDYSYQCECPIGFTGKYCDDDLDECEYAPCKNGGTCVNTVPGFHCKCGPSYSGDLCQKHAGFCASKPCQNNGECIEQLTGYRCQCSSEWSGRDCDTPVPQCKCENPHHECNFVNKKQVCNCPEGFEGDKCDKRIDICDKINNCQNGGQCIGNSNSSSCICPSNYSGEFCETPVGECLVEGKKCENGGSCRKNLVGYSCDCPRAYTGKWCEKPRFSSLVTKRPDLCQQGYCFNNGTCSLLLTGAKCTCLPGFTGSRCETPSDPCFNNLCENDSQCVPKDDSYSCSCEPGFVGSFCEHTCTCQEDQECVENSSKDGSVCITVATSPLPAVTTTTTGFTTTTTASSTQTVTTTSTASTTTVTATTARPVTPKISEMSTNMPVVIPLQDIYNVTSCEACIGAKRCLEYDNRKFCVCPNNKDGKFCEKPLDVCSSLNCTRFQECHVTRTSHNAIAQCSCPPGYNGEKCEQPTTVTFSQNSLFLHQSKNIMIGASSAAVIYTVELSFRTTAPHVHFVSGENILSQLQYSIGLSRGRLELNISSQVFDNFLEMNLNDGEWYKVVLNKTSEKTTVQIYEENGYQIAEKSLGVQTFEVFTTKFGLSGTKFMVGCLRDIKIDLDYVDPKEPSRSVDVRPGCERRVQCEKDTCQNGKCVDLWTNFRCECNRPFLPPFCINKLEEFTFGHKNESSRLTLKLNEEETMALRQRTDVSFLLRTNAENGSVIYMGEKGDDVATFISLEVQDGHIVAKSRLGGKRIMEMDGSAVINDNQPHLVELKRFNNHLKVYVDDKEDSQWTIDRPFSHPLLADQVLIGSDDTENSHLLKGSLQDMRINDKNVMFQENPPAFHVEPFGQSAFRKNLVKVGYILN